MQHHALTTPPRYRYRQQIDTCASGRNAVPLVTLLSFNLVFLIIHCFFYGFFIYLKEPL